MILQLRVINLRLTFFFCQSVSFRLVFASLNFLIVYCFYVVFDTLLPFIFFSSVLKAGIMWKWMVDDLTQALVNCLEKISLCKILTKAISLHHFSLIKTLLMLYESGWSASILKKKKKKTTLSCPPLYKMYFCVSWHLTDICLPHYFLTSNGSFPCNTITIQKYFRYQRLPEWYIGYLHKNVTVI